MPQERQKKNPLVPENIVSIKQVSQLETQLVKLQFSVIVSTKLLNCDRFRAVLLILIFIIVVGSNTIYCISLVVAHGYSQTWQT